MSRVRGRSKILAAAAVVVVACAALFVATQADASPPRCRLLSEPDKVTPLSEGTVDDLNSRKSQLDPNDLRTPSESDARIAAAVRANPDRTVWACGSSVTGQLVIVYRSKEDAYPCASMCPDDPPQVWVTCYQGFDPVTRRKTFQGACIGFWPQRG